MVNRSLKFYSILALASYTLFLQAQEDDATTRGASLNVRCVTAGDLRVCNDAHIKGDLTVDGEIINNGGLRYVQASVDLINNSCGTTALISAPYYDLSNPGIFDQTAWNSGDRALCQSSHNEFIFSGAQLLYTGKTARTFLIQSTITMGPNLPIPSGYKITLSVNGSFTRPSFSIPVTTYPTCTEATGNLILRLEPNDVLGFYVIPYCIALQAPCTPENYPTLPTITGLGFNLVEITDPNGPVCA